MLNKNLKSRKAQIGETTTWVVATIAIIVILAISILLAHNVDSDRTITYLDDKEKSFVATKSINSFLSSKQNTGLLENKNYTGFSAEVEKLLEILPKLPAGSAGGWNFELYDGDEKKIGLTKYQIVTNLGQYDFFETEYFLGQERLKFWLVCQGECKI